MILCGDSVEMLKTLPDEPVQCCITSPPYWGLRDYGHKGQIGLEKSPELYVAKMVEVFREVRRVLRNDGTLWLNVGDSYSGSGKGGNPESSEWSGFVGNKNRERAAKASKPIIPIGLKPKDLVGIPWRLAFALQSDGWYLRQDIIWSKPNPMPESVTDRCTKAHEYIFLLTKSARYYYDADAVKEPVSSAMLRQMTDGYGGNATKDYDAAGVQDPSETKSRIIGNMRAKRSVWEITTRPFKGAHFATFPPEIPEICIKAGTKKGDTVLDPFAGSGTTLEVAKRLGRNFIGIELNERYVKEIIEPRLAAIDPLFDQEVA